MPIAVELLSQEHVPAVREFNKRIAAEGLPFRFPECSIPQWLPRQDGIPLYQEYFVALEGQTVRGTFIMKPQAFVCNGEETMIAAYQLPISEGAINSRYVGVALTILKDALKRQPLLFMLGIGGYQETIARILKTMKWSMVACPFFFKVTHPVRFFQEIVFLRRKLCTRLIADLLTYSGLGWIALNAVQTAKAFPYRVAAGVSAHLVGSFSRWADEVWERAKNQYAMVAVRNTTILNRLYPSSNQRFIRIRVLRCDRTIGWAVVLNTKMRGHGYFGHMQVGSLIDCLAVEGEEYHVAAMATQLLERSGVDLIISNQLDRQWCSALSRNGYLAGPSNFLFAASPELARKLSPFEVNATKVHLTRGDGDGPINL